MYLLSFVWLFGEIIFCFGPAVYKKLLKFAYKLSKILNFEHDERRIAKDIK